MKIGVLGATGVVGQQMISVLEERNFPVDKLVPLASARSAGKTIKFKGQEITIAEAKEGAFDGLDIVLGAAENDIAREMYPYIKSAGALFIDNSSEFRLNPDVPLVVPEVNKEDAFNHNGIIANPNCVTIIALTAVNAINKLSEIKTMVASTYQAVSGAGKAGLEELNSQALAFAKEEQYEIKAFKHQIAFNLIPKIGGVGENGFSSEEMKLLNEGRKIMHLPDMKVCCTCVRVPVMRSHAISINLTTKEKLSLDQIREALSNAEGVVYLDDPNAELYPMPLNTSNQDKVFVGRLREDPVYENGIALWCCGDQIRKGAATNAIQIAELFI